MYKHPSIDVVASIGKGSTHMTNENVGAFQAKFTRVTFQLNVKFISQAIDNPSFKRFQYGRCVRITRKCLGNISLTLPLRKKKNFAICF